MRIIFFTGMIGVILIGGSMFACQWEDTSRSDVESFWLRGDTLQISLSDGNDWYLEIHPEGSGRIRYGQQSNSVLPFQEQTFDFAMVCEQLATDQPDNDLDTISGSVRVCYSLGDEYAGTDAQLVSAFLARQLFDQALESGLKGRADWRIKRRLRKRYRRHPPFSESE